MKTKKNKHLNIYIGFKVTNVAFATNRNNKFNIFYFS